MPAAGSSDHGLKANSIGFGTVLMQSIAQMAPAVGVLTTIAYVTAQTGRTAPLAYLAAFLIALLIAVPLAQLGRHLPSAGGFYTYVTVTVGPAWGFLVGWTYSWAVALVPAAMAAYTGSLIEDEAHRFGLALSWRWTATAVLIGVGAIGYRGVEASGRAVALLSLGEMAIVLTLAISGFLSPFAAVAVPVASTAFAVQPFFLAVVVAIFAFTGWEGAAAVAEEARDPRRSVPRAILASVVLVGSYYVICAWGLQVGIGGRASFVSAGDNPAFALSHRLWGPWSILTPIALLNSGLAVCIACTVDASRNWYAMARAGAMPVMLARTHPHHLTPHVATIVQTVVAIGVCLALGMFFTPAESLLLLGTAGTVIYVLVYVLGNIGVARFFAGPARDERNLVVHVAMPIASSVILLIILYLSLVPLPPAPLSYAPALAAVLIGSGGLALLRLHRRGKLAAYRYGDPRDRSISMVESGPDTANDHR